MNCGDEKVITVDVHATEHLALTQNAHSRKKLKYGALQSRVRCHVELSDMGS